MGRSTVDRTILVYNAAKNNDTEELLKQTHNAGLAVRYACEDFNITLDEPIVAAVAQAQHDNTALAVAKLYEMLDGISAGMKTLADTIQALSTEMSTLRMVVSGTRKDMNAGVDKVVESINVNGDILTKEHDKMVDILGGIKMNAKKLPNALRGNE